MSVWRFDKTPLLTLKQGESGIINVDTIVEPRDRSEVRGYLAVFDEDEYKDAEMSIFELLEPQKKLSLGKLATLKDQKVILKIEQYGTAGNLIDFTAKPIKRIEFDKIDQALALKKPLK